MKYYLKLTHIGTLRNLENDEDLQYIDNEQEVQQIKAYYAGNKPHHKAKFKGIDGFLVEIVDGEYNRVYAIENIYGFIGDLRNDVYKVEAGLK